MFSDALCNSWIQSILQTKHNKLEKKRFKNQLKICLFVEDLFKLYGPFLWGSTASRLQSHYEETVYFLTLSSQKFLKLIWLTLEGWKAESTLEPPSGFEHGTPELGIQRLNF